MDINASRTVGEYVLISDLHAMSDMVEEELIRDSATWSHWIHSASIGRIDDVAVYRLPMYTLGNACRRRDTRHALRFDKCGVWDHMDGCC